MIIALQGSIAKSNPNVVQRSLPIALLLRTSAILSTWLVKISWHLSKSTNGELTYYYFVSVRRDQSLSHWSNSSCKCRQVGDSVSQQSLYALSPFYHSRYSYRSIRWMMWKRSSLTFYSRHCSLRLSCGWFVKVIPVMLVKSFDCSVCLVQQSSGYFIHLGVNPYLIMRTELFSRMSIDTGLSISEVEAEYSNIHFDFETGKYYHSSNPLKKKSQPRFRKLTKSELRYLTK